ncbi:MAG: protein kinase, partial [Planctomycetota bacterium]|nr:protein kinase [Planctomycetota bacterium]
MKREKEKTLSCPYCGTVSVVNLTREGDFVCPSCSSKAALSEGGTMVLLEKGTVEDTNIGAQFGGYRIERLLGSGGMGRVYYAYQEAVDRPVALKVLSPAFVENRGLKERFIMEAKAAGRLLHPNIVTVFDAGEVEGKAYIVMEYVDGVSLAQKIFEEGALPVEEVLRIGRQIASALGYAHTCKVIHRDIKPANVLLRSDGTAKLADMGLAKRIDLPGMTMPGAVMGTPFYMAPEQAEDSASVDHRADIYSLGATMYHALTGQVPFGGGSTLEVLAKQKMEPLRFPKDVEIPQSVRALISKMMAKEPKERFQS